MKDNKPTIESDDLFRSRLDQIINLRHELVTLANRIDWEHFDSQLEPFYSHTGRPAVRNRLMIGLHLLKQMFQRPTGENELVNPFVRN